MPSPAAVLLPGTGSDEVFVGSAFATVLSAFGHELLAPAPVPGSSLAEGYLTALDDAARTAGAPVLVGGISFGAHVALGWALRNQHRCAGVLAALPAWTGAPESAPAAMAARASAELVRRDGVDAALAASTDGVPSWLAAELRRAWPRHGDGLAESLLAASTRPAPSTASLRALQVPVGIAACVDDPVHPTGVAHHWADALPRACVRQLTLETLGRDPASLGRAAVLAWLHARYHAE